MDGEAVFDAIGCQVGPDCLKDVLSKYGQRIKVYKAIKTALEVAISQEEQHGEPIARESQPSTSSRETSIAPCESSPGSPSVASQRSMTPSWEPQQTCSTLTTKRSKFPSRLPDPFPIPVFRQSTEQHLAKKIFYPDDRRYMVRVLSTMILTHVSKASVHDCEHVGKALVRKFPFLKEYQSWSQFMYVRCQNCNRPAKSPTTTTNEPKPKKNKTAANHVLVGKPEDEVTHGRNMDLLNAEWQKYMDKKATGSGIKELMSRTFLYRREWILYSEHPVSEIIKEYPCLSRVLFVEHEMDMICDSEDTVKTFEDNWEKYARIILSYSRSIPFQTKELKKVLEGVDGNPKGELTEVENIAALKCMASFLLTKRRKQDDKDSYAAIPLLLIDVPNSTPENEYSDSGSSHPYIVRKFDADQTIPASYRIFVEKEETVKCPDFTSALYVAFSLHYILNLTYHPKVHDLFTFIQEVIFQLKGETQKKSAALSNFSSAIAAASTKDSEH